MSDTSVSEPEEGLTASAKPESVLQRRKPLLAVGALLLALVLVLVYNAVRSRPESKPYEAYPAVPLELQVGDVPANLKVGVVYSLTEDTTQGRGLDLNAEGISVARWRLAQAGTNVELVTVTDQGSEIGAKEAIAKLKSAGVSAVIAATSGTHAQVLATEATTAKLPILFPYLAAPSEVLPGTWYGLSNNIAWKSVLEKEIDRLGCGSFVAIGTAARPSSLPMTEFSYDDVETTSTVVADAVKKLARPCISVDIDPQQMAQFVTQLRTKKVTAPILVGTQGMNSIFINSVTQSTAQLAGIYTIGIAHPAAVAATDQEGRGPQSRVFLEAAEQMKIVNAPSLIEKTSFTKRATSFDGLGHDALLAIVKAAGAAKSGAAADVANALVALDGAADKHLFVSPLTGFASGTYLGSGLVRLVDVGGQIVWANV